MKLIDVIKLKWFFKSKEKYRKKYDLDVLGLTPFDENLVKHSIERDSILVQNAIKEFYYRLNLPQVMS